MKGESAAYAWVVVLLMCFIITFVWIILSMVYEPVLFPIADQQLAGYTDALTILDQLKFAWRYWPVAMLVGMIIYGIVSSLRRDPESGYY